MIDDVFRDAAGVGAERIVARPVSATELSVALEVGGQEWAARWFERAQDASAAAAAVPAARPLGRFVLYPGGADPRLPGLARRIAGGGVLVSHRVGRRAVLTDRDRRTFTKVVRASRLPGLLEAARASSVLGVTVPEIVAVDGDAVTTAALPGRSLHELIAAADPALPGMVRAVGRALAALHAAEPPDGLPVHDSAAELAVTRRWEDLARRWGAALPTAATPPRPRTARGVALHRDLHDKQLLIGGTGPTGDPATDSGPEVGFIDFDLLAIGDPALDLANLLEHLRWREVHGGHRGAAGLRAALLDGYDPSAAVRAALPFHCALTRRRLAAVYHFRTHLRPERSSRIPDENFLIHGS
ncbi:phosphotransferase family protein [Nakamurella alba]|nr:aminoglycoside phosphotransferase family protein [Nakamurella alba]